jgi:hypothetical protein
VMKINRAMGLGIYPVFARLGRQIMRRLLFCT